MALREGSPFLGLYALYMRDAGLSPGDYAVALVAWSVSGFLLEVPSGALADRMDRRRLLIISGLLYLLTFILWAFVPTMFGFVAGFVLWGASTACESGTFQALLYDELSARGVPGDYGLVRSRAQAAGTLSLAAAIGLGGPLYVLGSYGLVLGASVVTTVAHIAALFLLPSAAPAEDVGEDEPYLSTLREGVGEALSRGRLRRILVAHLAVVVVIAVDEYVPNLWSATGIATDLVAYLLAAMVAAEALGSFGAYRLAGTRHRWVAALMPTLGAVLIGSGAWLGGWASAVGVVVGYGLACCHMVALDVRLQQAIEGRARATVTSVSGLVGETGAITSFAAVGALADVHGWPIAIALVVLLTVVPVGVTAWAAAVPPPG